MQQEARKRESERSCINVYMSSGGFKDSTTQFECNLERISIRQDESRSYLTEYIWTIKIKTRFFPRQDVAEDIKISLNFICTNR